MPIYEYVCMECESHFEELVRAPLNGTSEQVHCPDCEATNVSKQFSSFAVHGVTKSVTKVASGGGGGCCGGSCGCGH